MNKLPDSFGIKCPNNYRSNQKWHSFISWLNGFDYKHASGDNRDRYYGKPLTGNYCHSTNPAWFSKIITLEEWDRIVNPKFKSGDKVIGRHSGTSREKRGIYAGKHPTSDKYHIIIVPGIVTDESFICYSVEPVPDLTGEVREIDGRKYELKLVE